MALLCLCLFFLLSQDQRWQPDDHRYAIMKSKTLLNVPASVNSDVRISPDHKQTHTHKICNSTGHPLFSLLYNSYSIYLYIEWLADSALFQMCFKTWTAVFNCTLAFWEKRNEETSKMFFCHVAQCVIFWAISVVWSDGFSPAERGSPKSWHEFNSNVT